MKSQFSYAQYTTPDTNLYTIMKNKHPFQITLQDHTFSKLFLNSHSLHPHSLFQINYFTNPQKNTLLLKIITEFLQYQQPLQLIIVQNLFQINPELVYNALKQKQIQNLDQKMDNIIMLNPTNLHQYQLAHQYITKLINSKKQTIKVIIYTYQNAFIKQKQIKLFDKHIDNPKLIQFRLIKLQHLSMPGVLITEQGEYELNEVYLGKHLSRWRQNKELKGINYFQGAMVLSKVVILQSLKKQMQMKYGECLSYMVRIIKSRVSLIVFNFQQLAIKLFQCLQL